MTQMKLILLDATTEAEQLRDQLKGCPSVQDIRQTNRLMEFLQWAHMDKPDGLVMEAGTVLNRIHSLQNRLPEHLPVWWVGNDAQLTEIRQHIDGGESLSKPTTTEHWQQHLLQRSTIANRNGKSSVYAPPVAAGNVPRPSPAMPQTTTVAGEQFVTKPLPLGLFRPQAIAIGSSTGGPQALLQLFTSLKGRLPNLPIFITQHMPPKFTRTFAEQLQVAAGTTCYEATDGMPVKAGEIYVAPGDYHMTVKEEGGLKILRLNQDAPENFCRPAVDVMLRSLSALYGANLLVIILTGMGSDGLAGARICTDKGARLIGQDKSTSVVWGMPKAVADAGICHAILPLNDIPDTLLDWCRS